MTTSLTTSFLTLGGCRTRAIESPGEGPVILLLHGFSDQADTWHYVMEELAAADRRVVAVDLPGYGRADPVAAGPILPQLDAFVSAAIEAWTEAGQPPVVVGNSLGGALALRAALDPRVPMTGVVPISPAGFVHSRWITLVLHLHRVNPLLYTPIVPMAVFRWLAGRGFGYLAGGGLPLMRGVVSTHSAQFRRRSDVRRLLASVPQMAMDAADSLTGDETIDIPSLVLWGRHDRLTKVSGADVLAPRLSNGHVEILEDCGHCPQLQRPALIAEHLIRFVDGLTLGAAESSPA
jgi:pimeloyl-ACP methyl ester carboxylesterase